MDTKRLVTMMLLTFVVVFGWQMVVDKLYQANPQWKRPGQQANSATTTGPTTQSATRPATSTAGGAAATTGAAIASTQPAGATPAVAAAAAAPTTGLRVVSPATQPAIVTLGADEAFPLVVQIASQGAGLESVTLKEFRGSDRKTQFIFQQPLERGNALTRPMATRSVTVNGNELGVVAEQWNVERQDGRSVTFLLDLGVVRVRKHFELSDRTSPGQGYELLVRHSVENATDAAAKVKLAWTGPVTPPREHPTGPDLQIISAYDDGYQRAAVVHHMIEQFDASKTQFDLTKGEDNVPLLWAGTASVYFTAIERPEPRTPNTTSADYLARVLASGVNAAASDTTQRKVVLSLETTELDLAAGSAAPLELKSSVYLGPRWRKLLATAHYDQFPRDYDASLVLTSGPCGWCTFNWLINGLVWLLGVFHFLVRDWGLAIILLVVLVRSLLHPITKRSQVSMMRMGKLGPEMERLKKKYGDDKDELNRQMMALYKDQGVGAYLGCLPMFLQMPIWIALWSALNTTFELRQAPFFYGLTWIDDLAQQDALVHFGRTLHLPFGMTLSALNLLPLLLGVVFYLQQEFTPKPPATTPEQEMQQKMMKWMSLLFPIFLYNGPSGLNLYILTSTTIGIIESKRIRDHIKQQEEAEKAGKILVDAPKGMKKRRDDDETGPGAKNPKAPKEPKTGFAGWLEQLQKKAADLQREAERGRGK
ncbi:MAG TPA: membrane protein insertase YidC [Tepidisphaeraceae bacterium]|nr:membrane protein insertase YidC [Tepidisphaeraceae bacterium]